MRSGTLMLAISKSPYHEKVRTCGLQWRITAKDSTRKPSTPTGILAYCSLGSVLNSLVAF